MLEKLPATVGHALQSVRAGLDEVAYRRADLAADESLVVTSDAFADGGAIPARHTADGARISPPLRFVSVPRDAVSLALIVEDADSPTPAPLCHCLAWAIPSGDGGVHEAALDPDAMPTARLGAILGKNSFLSLGWLAPDPPTGHGPHRYVFQLYALDYWPSLEEGAGRSAVVKALAGHVFAKGMLVGTYERP